MYYSLLCAVLLCCLRASTCDSREESVTGRSAQTGAGGTGGSCSTSQPCSPSEAVSSMFTSDVGIQTQHKAAVPAAAAALQASATELQQQDVTSKGAASAEHLLSGSSAVAVTATPEASPEQWFEAWHSKPLPGGEQGYSSKTSQSVLLCSAVATDLQQTAPMDLSSHRAKVLQSLAAGSNPKSTGGRQQQDPSARDSMDARSGGSCSVTEATSPNAAQQLKSMRSL